MHRFPKPGLLALPSPNRSVATPISCPFTSLSGRSSPTLLILCTTSSSFFSLLHPLGLAALAVSSTFTPSKGWPTLRRRRPIRPYSYPPCLLHRQCRYRSGTGSPPRSPWAGPSAPSSRPLRTACARPSSSSRGMVAEAVVAQGAHWLGSAGWSCVGSQNHGSSECRAGTAGHRRRASEWAHHPTAGQVSQMPRNRRGGRCGMS